MNVAITYLIEDDNILFLYKDTRGYFVGPGGKNDSGETLLETATREFKEETGLVIRPKLGAISKIVSEEGAQTKEFTLLSFYATSYEGQLLRKTPEGYLSWHHQKELPDLPMFSGDKMIVQIINKAVQKSEELPVFFAKFFYRDNYKELLDFEITRSE